MCSTRCARSSPKGRHATQQRRARYLEVHRRLYLQDWALRTEAFACACACILLRHVNHAEDKPSVMNAERAIHMKSTTEVPAEGLSRTEPLHFSKDRLFSKQMCTLPTRTAYKLRWVPLPAITPITVLDVLTLLMAEAGEDAPATPEGQLEGQAEAKPKRYPRSRVRADGARRRTQAEIEARRKAKREGLVLGRQGRPVPKQLEAAWGRAWSSGPSAVRSSSRSNMAERNWGQEAWSSGPKAPVWLAATRDPTGPTGTGDKTGPNTWWKQDWWQSSDWQARTEDSNKDWQPDANQLSSRSSVPSPRVRKWEDQAARLKWQAHRPSLHRAQLGRPKWSPMPDRTRERLT